ncbi:MAG: hypothetical protein Fur0043_24090 [Anaerolineales bacterium]
MPKKQKKDKKPRLPKVNTQIPISRVRPLHFTSSREVLQRAREYPLYGCWVMEGWQESGITPVVIARQQSLDRLFFAVYLVDLYCLGVKDAFTRINVSKSRFERDLPKLCSGAPQACPVELAHEIVYGALEYAERYGFSPHPDFKRQMADQVLDPPEAHPRSGEVEFGKDGKPFFFAGPYDDERKIQQVLSTLQRTAGEGNYNYLLTLNPDDIDFESEQI